MSIVVGDKQRFLPQGAIIIKFIIRLKMLSCVREILSVNLERDR